jgi:hypothetical protein
MIGLAQSILLFDAAKELKKLQEEKKKQESLGPIYELADRLHGKLCRCNHIDDCGWFYEVPNTTNNKHNWDGNAHQRWLEKANKLFLKCQAVGVDPSYAIEMADLLND